MTYRVMCPFCGKLIGVYGESSNADPSRGGTLTSCTHCKTHVKVHCHDGKITVLKR